MAGPADFPRPDKVRTRDRRFLIQAAAYLRATRPQLTQKQLRELLNVANQTYVSRLLQDAVKLGYLQIEHRFERQEIADARLREIKAFCDDLAEQQRDLKLRLQQFAARYPAAHFHDLHIVATRMASRKPSRSLKPPRIFGRGAAPILLQLLQHCSGLGITWGHTLASCVAALRDLRQHGQWPKTRKTVVFPLRGEPMWLDRRVGDSPSFLAAELQDLFVPGKQALSLSVVPAFTPLDLSRKSVQALLHNVVSYARIFGGGRAAGPGHPRPLIETAAILTGIGAVDEGLGAWTSEALKAAQVPLDRLRDIAIGDIAGVFLPKEGLDPDDRKELSAINANWWGLERQHLAAAAGRAGRGHHPGTIALALGGHAKARVLLAALREGLCSTLVVSDIIADALTDVLDRE